MQASTIFYDDFQSNKVNRPQFHRLRLKHSSPPLLKFQTGSNLLYNESSFQHTPFLPPLQRPILSDKDLLPLPSPPSDKHLKLRTQRLSAFYQSRALWLCLYFLFNLSLTLYNKSILGHFPFPYTLTAIHSLCGVLGGHCISGRGLFPTRRLNASQKIALALFSILYAVNIIASNASLGLVSIPMHQVIRSCTPLFVILFSFYLFNTRSSRSKIYSLIPVIIGVGLATFGDFHSSRWGILLTLSGTILAALKTIFTSVLQTDLPASARKFAPSMTRSSSMFAFQFNPQRILLSTTGLHLHPLDLLIRLSPLAFIQCVIYAYISGEATRVQEYAISELSFAHAIALILNGVIAFGLNVVSFTANKKAGALSMAVAANIKQVLTILLAVAVFQSDITYINTMGIFLTLIGGAWYAAVEYKEMKQR